MFFYISRKAITRALNEHIYKFQIDDREYSTRFFRCQPKLLFRLAAQHTQIVCLYENVYSRTKNVYKSKLNLKPRICCRLVVFWCVCFTLKSHAHCDLLEIRMFFSRNLGVVKIVTRNVFTARCLQL